MEPGRSGHASPRRARFCALIDESLPATAEAVRALSARVSDVGRNRRLRLAGVWNNVTLEAGDPPAEWNAALMWPATARSARLAEALWRSAKRTIAVPREVVSLLQSSPGYEEVDAERREIVRRFAAFLATTEDYSAIGAAGVFVL
jgi:hypothetical protein